MVCRYTLERYACFVVWGVGFSSDCLVPVDRPHEGDCLILVDRSHVGDRLMIEPLSKRSAVVCLYTLERYACLEVPG